MFSTIKKKMQAKFGEMTQLGTLYYVEVDRNAIWDIYLNAMPPEHRQGNNCTEYGAANSTAVILEAQLEIVKFVIDTKQAEAEEKKVRENKLAQRAFLLNLKEKKEMEKLEGLSIEEIEKQLAATE